MPIPIRASPAVVLISSNRRSDPSVGSTSTSSRGAGVSCPSALRPSAEENSMLLIATARRRPSLSSSRVANSRSACPFAIIMRPSVSVSMIGSVTRSMMLWSISRSRRSRRSVSRLL